MKKWSTRATTLSCRYPAASSRRITSAAPDMDLLNDNECFLKAKEMLHKAGQEKHGSHSSNIARWLNDYKNRKSLSDIGWNEQDIMLLDRIALENYSFVLTRAERIRNSEHWILELNQDGAQQPSNQRPDFAQAKRECKRSHDEYVARTQQEYRTALRSQQVRQRKEQPFDGIEEYDYTVDPRTGWISITQRGETCRLRRHRPRPQIGNGTIGRQ